MVFKAKGYLDRYSKVTRKFVGFEINHGKLKKERKAGSSTTDSTIVVKFEGLRAYVVRECKMKEVEKGRAGRQQRA